LQKIKIAHIIKPCKVSIESDLYTAQPITFESLRIAKEYSKNEVEVTLFTSQYIEEIEMIPDFFNKTSSLSQSILDFEHFEHKRKLPLLKEVLDKLDANSDADYFIYSNVDISVQPYFYLTVAAYIRSGLDAFVINRRTISKKYTEPYELPLMYGEIGKEHPGHDCFLFSKSAYQNFLLGNICLGTGWVGRVLLWNLFCFSKKLGNFPFHSLTFHVGDDMVWRKPKYQSYFEFNRKEAQNIHKLLQPFLTNKEIILNNPFTNSIWEELKSPLGFRTKKLSNIETNPYTCLGKFKNGIMNFIK